MWQLGRPRDIQGRTELSGYCSGAGGTGVIAILVWSLTHVWLTVGHQFFFSLSYTQRVKSGTSLACGIHTYTTALVTPWVPTLHTAGAISSRKLLITGLLALTHRLWITAGGGPVASQANGKHLLIGRSPRPAPQRNRHWLAILFLEHFCKVVFVLGQVRELKLH